MFGITGLAKWIAVAVVVSAVSGAVIWTVKMLRDDGARQVRLEMARQAADAERERIKDDAKLRSLSDYDLCVGALRSRGMPIAACDELRGVSGEQPEPGRDGGLDPR